ncbi:MAG: endolytic transglycosylase MltG [Desulfuromonadales bacterium]|nr:MAG: endolytic transglycosylase MltG [Desulfuromonadales bacterium]
MEENIPENEKPAGEATEAHHGRVDLSNRKTRAILALAIILILTLPLRYLAFIATPAGDGGKTQVFDFEKGYSLARIARELEKEGIVSSARLFVVFTRLKGDAGRLQAGEYQFTDGMKPSEILRRMVAGEVYVRRFAVPEGYSIHQVAELLDGQKLLPKERFLKAATDPTILKELGIEGRSVEGYLFPSTYDVKRKMDEEALIRAMVAQFDQVYGAKFAEASKRLGMSRHQVITLASLIEKEAVAPAERPIISSVFHNRLQKKMRLQSDPTAVYGVRAFAGNVTKHDIERPTPYNTYLIEGLPPGPIGNPSEGAIEAALNPARTSYLYFVARKDGTHHFSTTLDEHNAAVRTYLK